MRESRTAYLVDAARTPYGRRGGALSSWHPVDLAGELLGKLVQRAAVEPGAVGTVVLGCVSQVGAQAYNIARRAVLAAGWPEQVPGFTVDCHAASSTLAVQMAAEAVLSGVHSLAIAGGVEVMTAVPLGATLAHPALGKPYGRRLAGRYSGGFPPPGLVAEEVARRWSLGRAKLDAWVAGSYKKALAAQSGKVPYLLAAGSGPGGPGAVVLERDEMLNSVPTRGELRALVPAYQAGGVVTAANMASEGDGASAVVVASAAAVRRLGVVAMARLVSFATAGESPELWPVATVPATLAALEGARVNREGIDWWFVHESSAAAVLAWALEVGAPLERVNPDGGALASTSPAGAAGAGLFAMAATYLERARGLRALVCAAGEGGLGTACVLEQAS